VGCIFHNSKFTFISARVSICKFAMQFLFKLFVLFRTIRFISNRSFISNHSFLFYFKLFRTICLFQIIHFYFVQIILFELFQNNFYFIRIEILALFKCKVFFPVLLLQRVLVKCLNFLSRFVCSKKKK